MGPEGRDGTGGEGMGPEGRDGRGKERRGGEGMEGGFPKSPRLKNRRSATGVRLLVRASSNMFT